MGGGPEAYERSSRSRSAASLLGTTDNELMFTQSGLRTDFQFGEEKEIVLTSITDRRLNSDQQYPEIYSKRVHLPWYRRYQDLLGEGSMPANQPYEEVQVRDEELALIYYYGEIPDWAKKTDSATSDERKRLLTRFQKQNRDIESDESVTKEPVQTFGNITTKRKEVDVHAVFGPSQKDRKKLNPVIEFLAKMHMKRHREWKAVALPPNSKWKLLNNEQIRELMKNMANMLKRKEAHRRFKRALVIVKCVTCFIRFLADMAKSTDVFFQDIYQFQKSQTVLTDELIAKTKMARAITKSKLVFNEMKYIKKSKITITKELHLILTKRWSQRTDLEVEMIVKSFQSLRSFVEYPGTFQRRLARVAWLISISPARTVIREGHLATDFYFLINGTAKMTQLHGSPCIRERGIFKLTKDLREGDSFGEESVTDDQSLRDYTVETTSPCVMLSINVNDYVEMILEANEDEVVSEHVAFLSNLEFMEGFPYQKLLEEGNDNILNYYYRPGSLITKSVKMGVYVFAVKSGSIDTFVELVPPFVKSHIKPREKSASVLKMEDRPRITKADTRKDDSHFTSPDPVRHPLTPSDSVHRNINNLMMKVGGNTNTGVAASEIAHLSEEKNLYLTKWTKLAKTLSPYRLQVLKRMGAVPENFNPLLNYNEKLLRESKVGSTKYSSAFSEISEANSIEEKMSDSSSESSVAIHIVVQENPATLGDQEEQSTTSLIRPSIPTPRSILHRKITKTSTTVQETLHERKESEDKVKKKRLPFGAGKEIKVEIYKDAEPEPYFGQESFIKRSRGSNIYPYSRWKRERRLVKGDSIGYEWLDYNDRPFDPPQDDVSLVSNGCECIMIRRSFLLKYLRKEW